jgi:hypothetical protein
VASSPAFGRSVGSDESPRDDVHANPPPESPSAARAPEAPRSGARRRPITRLVFLAFGLLVALYLGMQGPKEQHVRVVLGAAAPEVTSVDLQYLTSEGEVAVEARFAYPKGSAPRVVPHEPRLANGDYRLQIDVDAQGGRRAIQRQVTLGGGSTQVDISSALARENQPPE